jgi:hypothetical protein
MGVAQAHSPPANGLREQRSATSQRIGVVHRPDSAPAPPPRRAYLTTAAMNPPCAELEDLSILVLATWKLTIGLER